MICNHSSKPSVANPSARLREENLSGQSQEEEGQTPDRTSKEHDGLAWPGQEDCYVSPACKRRLSKIILR